MSWIHWFRWPFRIIVSLVLVQAVIFTISYVQERFDRSDRKKALQVIQLKWPDATDCRAEVVSRFRGQVRVSCGEGSFLVDVVRGLIEQEH